ncbi:MAG: hypothetical protein M3T96_03710 [Acidobacteriota bacterium]|nr:hypothetical protein [Acidobacteriota bacterium]
MNAPTNRQPPQNHSAARFSFVALLLCGFILLAPSPAFAATFAEYRAAVKDSRLLIQNLLDPDTEDESFDDFEKLERETLRKIRTQIPAAEKIEWQNVTIETDNRWLTEKLDKFEKTPQTDDRRWNILTEVGERLAAIERQLGELEKQTAATQTKDEDKRKLAEILRREEYQKPAEKQESLIEKIERKIVELLARFFPRPNITPSVADGFSSFSFVLQILLYALILGIIAFVVYRFAPFFAKRLKNSKRGEQSERVILGERLAADATARSLFAEAEDLARSGDLRGAIRQGYIALLCDLSDREIVRLSRHKTNRDYLRDVRRRDELCRSLNNLTLNYERHWYGFDEAQTIDWEDFKTGYQRAVNSQ